MKKSNLYIRFLRLVELLHSKSKLRKLDGIENSLLNNIMISDDAGGSIFVGDLLGLHALGSQATLHGRIKRLRLMGYINLITQSDARCKRVVPTLQAYKYFNSLSGCMSSAKPGSK